MQINYLGDQIGAEILDVDVRSLSAQDFDSIYQTWLRSGVLAIRDQSLTISEFLEHGRRFGSLLEHPSKMTRHPEHPELTVMGINKFDVDGNLIRAVYARGGESWHTDGAYETVSFKATQLYALAIPSRGGDTLFASMYAAYEALPNDLKENLEGRKGPSPTEGEVERPMRCSMQRTKMSHLLFIQYCGFTPKRAARSLL